MSDATARKFIQRAYDRGGDLNSALIQMGSHIDNLESYIEEAIDYLENDQPGAARERLDTAIKQGR